MRKLALVLLLLLAFGAVAFAQTAGEVSHVVQRGETIYSISRAYGVTMDAILIRNNIIDPNRIVAGQVLIIPTGAVTVPWVHVVEPGETLYSIAIRYNTTVDALIAINSLGSSAIAVGQVLTLPATGGPATFPRTYILDTGDTLRSVAERFGITWQAIAAYNNIANANYVQAGTTIVIPPVGYVPPTTPPVGQPIPPAPANRVYIVQRGDTLSSIAVRFGVTLESIRALNTIRSGNVILVGDVLILPPVGGPVVGQPHPTTPRQTVNGYYTVRAGDTLFAIASSFGVNIYDLAEVNGLLNLNSIYAGQLLRVPGR
jgi:peptidoglycan endopeptidase LytF